jgi:hypothetical protein
VPKRALLLAEWLILTTLVALRTIGGTAHSPERLLRWCCGEMPQLNFPALKPYLSLYLGICNLFLLAGLLLVFAESRWAERARWAVTAWFLFALVIVPVLRDIEIRASYAGTAMGRTADSDADGWRSTGYEHNPAFEHVPYLPAVLYLAAATSWLPDIRLFYLLCAFVFALLIARRFPDGPKRRIAVLLALTNPLLLPYLIIGRNEILLLVPLTFFCGFVSDGRWRAAAWSLAAALCIKQFAVAAVPFLVLAHRRPRDLWPMVALPLLTCLPFLIWDARSFLDDTLWWNLGGGADAYPIKWTGWGLSPLAYGLNLVDSPRGANPFGWVALPAQLLAVVILGRRVRRDPSPREVLLASGVLLFVMLFTSRAFAFSYLAVPMLFLAAAAHSSEAWETA